ncbi:MAG: hypothetical protein HY460_02440 [Parcubacteria group bacterium]|nr:hypothetical protein [Parcubacteria group bacterium]
MTKGVMTVSEAVNSLVASAYPARRKLDLQMSGDPQYRPTDLRPYLGYDQRVKWQVIVEWFWMAALAESGVMPARAALHLRPELLRRLLMLVTTTKVTEVERTKTQHDILALLDVMRAHLPRVLHRYLHLALTSYDTISTAYALQWREVYESVFLPRLRELDVLWRAHILAHSRTLQIGRTHLQDALPITVGAWLGVLHNRFVECARNARRLVRKIPGKFSGAVGTRAALRALAGGKDVGKVALEMLGLPRARMCTQLTPPEPTIRFFMEIELLSSALANLGDDVRHLQASSIEEVGSASSTSSTMTHKTSNPVAAEQFDGMNVSVRGEVLKVIESGNSTLQRDLRYSNVMRGYGAALVFTYQQILTAIRLMKSLTVNEERCRDNFRRVGNVVVSELLHLSLQIAGYPDAHQFVNQVIVPRARQTERPLDVEMEYYIHQTRDGKLRRAWKTVPAHTKHLLAHPDQYLGDAVKMAKQEARNAL